LFSRTEIALKRITNIVLMVFFILSSFSLNIAQGTKPSPTPQTELRQKSKFDSEKIYMSAEVDVKATVKNQMKNLPELRGDCPDTATVKLRAILHKSGKVKDVVLIKGVGCSYDKQAIEAVRKYKFSPAVKDGQAVSQYADIEYKSERILNRRGRY